MAVDLEPMLALCSELWPRVRATYGQIAWWASLVPHGGIETRVVPGRGWGFLLRGELEFEARDPALLEELLEWAEPAEVPVRTDDRDAIEILLRHGYSYDAAAPWMRVNARTLEELDEPVLPPGYRLRTVEERDYPSRVATHRSGFHPSRFTEEVYSEVRASPAYRADLDCVAVGPEGDVVAYALAWLDDANGVGELEPVATHADHRRRGLARAVNLFALHRLREERATTALVGSRGDPGYPVPTFLYESVGFRELARRVPYVRRK